MFPGSRERIQHEPGVAFLASVQYTVGGPAGRVGDQLGYREGELLEHLLVASWAVHVEEPVPRVG